MFLIDNENIFKNTKSANERSVRKTQFDQIKIKRIAKSIAFKLQSLVVSNNVTSFFTNRISLLNVPIVLNVIAFIDSWRILIIIILFHALKVIIADFNVSNKVDIIRELSIFIPNHLLKEQLHVG